MRVDTRSKVAQSQFLDLINECFQSHWSAASVYKHLCQTYGDGYPHSLSDDEMWTRFGIPSYKSLQRYRDAWMPSATVLPDSLIAKRVGNLDVNVDTLQAVARLLPIMEARIERALVLEENMNGMLLQVTDAAVDTYVEVWEKYVKHKFDLGYMKRALVRVHSTEGGGDENEGGGVAGGGEGEIDYDELPDDVLDRILRGERYRVTQIEQGPRASRRRASRRRRTSEGAAGESAPSSD